MENRNVRHGDRNEWAIRTAEFESRIGTKTDNGGSLDREELQALIEFFQLLDRWDREEVVQ